MDNLENVIGKMKRGPQNPQGEILRYGLALEPDSGDSGVVYISLVRLGNREVEDFDPKRDSVRIGALFDDECATVFCKVLEMLSSPDSEVKFAVAPLKGGE